jgi:hypothetical protein
MLPFPQGEKKDSNFKHLHKQRHPQKQKPETKAKKIIHQNPIIWWEKLTNQFEIIKASL